MNDSMPATTVRPRFAPRLVRSNSFEDATASVEAALDQLRKAEDTLERQLADLRGYIRQNTSLSVAH